MNSSPQIHGRPRSFSVSAALDQLGDDLRVIRDEDGLTWKDVGRVLGKSDDRASDYANGLSEMPVSAFLLGCREWNGRFANGVFSMIGMKLVDTSSEHASDSERLCRILRLAHALSVALNDDATPGRVDEDELRDIGSETLDLAARAIDALRQRLTGITDHPPAGTRLSAVG